MNLFGVGPLELLVIMVLALVVFGPERLPEIGRQLGRAVGQFQRVSQELSRELSMQLDEEVQAKKGAAAAAPQTSLPPAPSVPEPELALPAAGLPASDTPTEPGAAGLAPVTEPAGQVISAVTPQSGDVGPVASPQEGVTEAPEYLPSPVEVPAEPSMSPDLPPAAPAMAAAPDPAEVGLPNEGAQDTAASGVAGAGPGSDASGPPRSRHAIGAMAPVRQQRPAPRAALSQAGTAGAARATHHPRKRGAGSQRAADGEMQPDETLLPGDEGPGHERASSDPGGAPGESAPEGAARL